MLSAEIEYRQKAVIEAIIEHHVLTARPVSSASVARKCGLGLSAASMRNVMAELEEAGYLEQPHTSAGRVPTDKGYRLYVDNMMKIRGLTKREKEVITEELKAARKDVDETLRMACQVLSRIWSHLALALGPGITDGILKRLDLIPVSSERILVVISVASGVIRTVFVEVDKEVDQRRLEATTRAVNERLAGLSLSTAWKVIGDEPSRFSQEDPVIRQVLVRLVKGIISSDLKNDLYLDGAYRVLVQPEFESRDLLGTLLRVVEAKEPLARELSLFRYQEGPRVMIGRENSVSELSHLSMVGAGFRVGRVRGAIGLLGPMRMPYSRLIPAVQFVARSIDDLLSGQ